VLPNAHGGTAWPGEARWGVAPAAPQVLHATMIAETLASVLCKWAAIGARQSTIA